MDRNDPLLLEAAKNDGTLARMIKHNAPLTREEWIKANWGGNPPKPWCVVHENEVPEFWQDHTKVEA